MSPELRWKRELELCFPRVSGDEPWTNRWRWWGYSFSPRERG